MESRTEMDESEYNPPDTSRSYFHKIVCQKDCEETVPDTNSTGNNSLHCAVLKNNVDQCLSSIKSNNVNAVNFKGETPLHLASRNISPIGHELIKILIENGADVNVQNKWGQTPIHYAASVEAWRNLEFFAKVPGVKINIQDVNGFTALHTLMCSSGKDEFIDSDVVVVTDTLELFTTIEIFMRTGSWINIQTNYGHSLLHLAAVRKDNASVLDFLLAEIPGLILNLKNKMGEHFLHIYADHDIWEEVMALYDKIIKYKGLSVLQDLLNDKDCLGRTPWGIMVDTANISDKAMKKILKYGISVGESDNLGNTVLHRVAGVSTGWHLQEILKLILDKFPNLNSANIYGESAAFVLFLQPVFEIFLKYGMDFNTTDRWNRTTLMSILKHNPIPGLLEALLQKAKIDANQKDINGSTALHIAAYHDYPEHLKLLLRYGADKNIRDKNEDKAVDTARRNNSLHCFKLLQADTEKSVLYAREMSFEDILLFMPSTIKNSIFQLQHGISTALGLPPNIDKFLDHLLNRYYTRPPEHIKEVNEIVFEVNSLVAKICSIVASYDNRFKMSVVPTGSTAEGTKVGRPDEFDYVLCLDELVEIADIVMTKSCIETGFACLKFKESREEYLPFSDKDNFFLAYPFLQHLFKYLRRAINEKHLWENGDLYYNYEDKVEVIHGKPVFNFSVYWIGSIYKSIKVSIDLVPAIYKKGWWPPNISVDEIPMMNVSIKNAGCVLILQTKSRDFDKKRHVLVDDINNTCNIDENIPDFPRQRMLRVSAAPAEIALVKSMPEKFRRAYALSKIIKGKELCPEIEIDKFPSSLLMHKMSFQEKTVAPIKPYRKIKSYMLKNCLFYVLQEYKLKPAHELTIKEITGKTYSYLLHFADSQYLNPYFLPYSDVFEFEKNEKRSSYKGFMHLLTRELSIKLVMGMLNIPFPQKVLD